MSPNDRILVVLPCLL